MSAAANNSALTLALSERVRVREACENDFAEARELLRLADERAAQCARMLEAARVARFSFQIPAGVHDFASQSRAEIERAGLDAAVVDAASLQTVALKLRAARAEELENAQTRLAHARLQEKAIEKALERRKEAWKVLERRAEDNRFDEP